MHTVFQETHPLIEAAVKTLAGNAEQHLAAKELLQATFNPHDPNTAETLKRLENADKRRFLAAEMLALWAMTGITLLLAAFTQLPEIRALCKSHTLSFMGLVETPPLPPGLSEKERLLLDDPAWPPLERKRLLQLIDPGNPAYYSEYVFEHVSQKQQLPQDYLETVSKIAPDNAFFLYYAAAQTGRDAIKENPSSSSAKPRSKGGVRLSPIPHEKEFSITDQEALDQSMALIAKAAELPRFQTYECAMMMERSRAFPANTMADFICSLMHIYGTSSGSIHLVNVGKLMSARAEQLSKTGNKEDFLVLAHQRNAFLSGLASNKDSILVGELVFGTIAFNTSLNFHAAADRLGLVELADTYRKQRDAFLAEKDRRDIQRSAAVTSFPEQNSSLVASLSLPFVGTQVASPPPITAEDLKPLRLAEHDIASRLGMISAALILLLACLPVFLFRFAFPRVVRLPAKRLAVLLRPADWAWVFLCGIVLPITLYLIINRLTPLGGRDYGLDHFLFVFPGIHLLAILLSLLTAPALLIRWRLSKRLSPFGFDTSYDKPTGILLLLLLGWSLAAYPVLVRFGDTIPTRIAVCSVPVLWLGNILLNLVLAVIGNPSQRIARTTTSIALIPAYAMGITALCMTLPIFITSEKHWVRQDSFFHINAEAPDLGAYEFKIARQKKKEINAILGFE